MHQNCLYLDGVLIVSPQHETYNIKYALFTKLKSWTWTNHSFKNTFFKLAQAVKTLLANNAKTDISNKRGQTAYDVAVKLGNRGIISCFTSNLGNSMLIGSGKKQKSFVKSSSRPRNDELNYDNDFDFWIPIGFQTQAV